MIMNMDTNTANPHIRPEVSKIGDPTSTPLDISVDSEELKRSVSWPFHTRDSEHPWTCDGRWKRDASLGIGNFAGYFRELCFDLLPPPPYSLILAHEIAEVW